MKIPFLSFDSQFEDVREELFDATKKVFNSKWYILGKNLTNFEKNYAKINNIKYAVGVGSGLDALIISLKSLNITKGDEVIVASNAYIASWLAISNVGATIIPVEPNPQTFNLDPTKIEEKITSKTKAIMPVHLYGQPCEMDKIMDIALRNKLFVVEDNAQSHLATFNGKPTGTYGNINATSFYPSKNIGAIGEAGCITTMDDDLSEFSKTFRNYGSKEKYYCDIIGSNSRLDEIQAAILNVKLKHIQSWNKERQKIAKRYDQLLSKNLQITIPYVNPKAQHVYHLYVIKVDKRDQLQEFLKEKGIGTSIHYPIPPHLQKAYAHLGYKKGDFPIAEELANTALSLPVYPGLKDESIIYICNLINEFFKN
mgnify:CR=1 FL=1